MSLSKKRAEMEQVNPSLQNTEKRHRKDSLILERSFFPFWSLENIPSWHNLERGTELRSSTGRATIQGVCYILVSPNTSGITENITMPVVILKTRKGLSREQKRRIVGEFTETLVSTTGITPELVTILIEEHELEDIGKAGKLRCDWPLHDPGIFFIRLPGPKAIPKNPSILPHI